MPQRSFRLSDECLADLNRIAERLALLDRHAPNQTKALAWAVARGVDAIEHAEKEAKGIPAGIEDQIKHVSGLLHGLAQSWRRAAVHGQMTRFSRDAEQNRQETELKQLRGRVAELEADLERARAKPYIKA